MHIAVGLCAAPLYTVRKVLADFIVFLTDDAIAKFFVT